MKNKIKINLYAVLFCTICLFHLSLTNLEAEVNFNDDMPDLNKITEYKYSLNNFEMEYSQYGYKKEDNLWKITNLPVELSFFNTKKNKLNYNYLLNVLPLTVVVITGMIYYSKR